MNPSDNIAIDPAAKKRPAPLAYLLLVIFVAFFGILIAAYVATKRANPVMLDLHGNRLDQGKH